MRASYKGIITCPAECGTIRTSYGPPWPDPLNLKLG